MQNVGALPSIIFGLVLATISMYSRSGTFPLNEFAGTPSPLLKEALEAAYEEYAVCFSEQDIACLQRFLAADVEFVSQSLPRLYSRTELLEFFGGLWRSLKEDLTVHGYRYEKGWMFVDLANTLTVNERIPDLGGKPFETGQYHLRGEVGYKIVDGKISKIFDGVDPFAD